MESKEEVEVQELIGYYTIVLYRKSLARVTKRVPVIKV